MKYILTPILRIIIVLFVSLVWAPAKWLWYLIYHFEVISYIEATSLVDTESGEKVTPFDCPAEQFFTEIFFPYRNIEDENENIIN